MQPLLSARPPVQVCSCSVPTLVRFPAPLHSLITGNTSLSIPGHAEILHNYLGFRTKFEQKKNMRPFAGICARFAGICARFAGTPGPRNCENQKSEQQKTVSAQGCRLRLFNHKQHASLRTEEEGVVGSQPGILLLIGLQSCGQLACEGFYPVLQPIPSPRQCGCGLRGVGSRLQERPPVARYEGEA